MTVNYSIQSVSALPVKSLPFKSFKTIIGATLLSLPAVFAAVAGNAQTLNPCPRLYYEEPFNTTRSVPQGCPPNAATQTLIDQGRYAAPQTTPAITPSQNVPVSTPPSPDERNAIATITPSNGTVDVQITNNTSTTVNYLVVGQTQERTLNGKQTVVLQDLPAPVNINLVRPDGGFVQVVPQTSPDPGELAVVLNEAANLDTGNRTLEINAQGRVFAY